MKKILIIAAVIFSYSASAQSAKEITTKYNRVSVPGVEITYKNSKDIVETALNDYLDKNLKRKKSSRGYNMYDDVRWTDVSEQNISVFSKVDGGKNSATVTMLISSPSMAFYSSLTNSNDISKLKSFLEGFDKEVSKTQLTADIGTQESEVKKVEDKIAKNQKQGDKLLKDKERLEKDMADNAKELEDLNKALQNEKDKLQKVKN